MDGRARIGRFSSPKAIDEDAMKRAARDDGRAVVGGDATRDAREGTRDARVFFCVFFVRSVVRGTVRGRVATFTSFRRPREISSRPSAGNAMMAMMTRAMDDDEDDED